MTLMRIACIFGKHDLTVWRKCGPQFGAVSDDPTQERHCKRNGCEHVEYKRVRATKPRARKPDPMQDGPADSPGRTGAHGGGEAPAPVVTQLPDGGTLMSWPDGVPGIGGPVGAVPVMDDTTEARR